MLKQSDFTDKQILLDTNILIYQLNGRIDISDELSRAKALYISAITEAELFAGVDKTQIKELEEFLDAFVVMPVTSEVARLAGALKLVFKRHSLKDLIIAATAQQHKLTILTANKKDFQGITTKKTLFLDLD